MTHPFKKLISIFTSKLMHFEVVMKSWAELLVLTWRFYLSSSRWWCWRRSWWRGGRGRCWWWWCTSLASSAEHLHTTCREQPDTTVHQTQSDSINIYFGRRKEASSTSIISFCLTFESAMTNWIYIFKCSEGMVFIGWIGIKRNMIWSGMILILPRMSWWWF